MSEPTTITTNSGMGILPGDLLKTSSCFHYVSRWRILWLLLWPSRGVRFSIQTRPSEKLVVTAIRAENEIEVGWR